MYPTPLVRSRTRCVVFNRHILNGRPARGHGEEGVEHVEHTANGLRTVAHFCRNCSRRFGYHGCQREGTCTDAGCAFGHDHESLCKLQQDTQVTSKASAVVAPDDAFYGPAQGQYTLASGLLGNLGNTNNNYLLSIPKGPTGMGETGPPGKAFAVGASDDSTTAAEPERMQG